MIVPSNSIVNHICYSTTFLYYISFRFNNTKNVFKLSLINKFSKIHLPFVKRHLYLVVLIHTILFPYI